MSKLNVMDWIALILVIVGGLNWGLVAVGWNLVAAIFGAGSSLEMIVYCLVGISALYTIICTLKKLKAPKPTM